MQKPIKIVFPLSLGLLIVSIVLIQACSPSLEIQPGARRVPIQIFLTDDPGDYDQVNIDLLEVSVKMDSLGFQTLQTYPGIYDLLQLQNGLDTLIVNDSLPPGELKEIRLLLGENNSIMVDSVLYELKVPSGQSSGLKIKFNQGLVQDSLAQITLDFDAGASVVEKGNGSYSLKPVIRVLD